MHNMHMCVENDYKAVDEASYYSKEHVHHDTISLIMGYEYSVSVARSATLIVVIKHKELSFIVSKKCVP